MTELAQWDALKTAIEEAQSLPSIKEILDKAEGLPFAVEVGSTCQE